MFKCFLFFFPVNPNNFNCPLPNGHFRDVRDCSLFYHCVKNVAYSGRCKDHNAFDVYSLRCVPRAMVEGCDIMPTVPLMALTTPSTSTQWSKGILPLVIPLFVKQFITTQVKVWCTLNHLPVTHIKMI